MRGAIPPPPIRLHGVVLNLTKAWGQLDFLPSAGYSASTKYYIFVICFIGFGVSLHS